MVKVFNKGTNELLGRINEDELAFLQDQLEEEGINDRDYYLCRDTIEEFAGIHPASRKARDYGS